MMKNRILLIGLTLLAMASSAAAQQKSDRTYIRSGNRNYNDSIYDQAEVKYRKALEMNPKSADAMYNLGNTLIREVNKKGENMSEEELQKYAKDIVAQYNTAASMEKDQTKLADIYHNMGDFLYLAQNYAESAEAFKQALRNNPQDDETRYNLAKALYMLKNQQQQQDQQDQQQDQQDEEKQNEQQQQQQQQQEQEQQQQQQQQQDAQQQPAQKTEDISEENAEQILQALMQDEKDLQDKVKRMQQQQPRKLEKDW